MPKAALDSDESPVSKAIGTSGHLSMHDEYIGSSSNGVRSNKKSRKSLKSMGLDPRSSLRTLTNHNLDGDRLDDMNQDIENIDQDIEGETYQIDLKINVPKKSKTGKKRATSTKRPITTKKKS